MFLPAIFLLLAYLGSRVLRRYMLAKETVMLDLEFVSNSKSRGPKIPGTAIICGGSMGGLLAARICHDHFENVVIVEAESWLSTKKGREPQSWTEGPARARLIQWRSLHGSPSVVYLALTTLFPRFAEEYQKSNFTVFSADFHLHFWGHRMLVPHTQYLDTIHVSRPALETLVRRITLDPEVYPNIRQIDGSVVGVAVDRVRNCLHRVTVRSKDGLTDLDASFVIDCTGQNQVTVKWLEEAGFRPRESPRGKDLRESFDPKMHYCTCRFVVPPSLAGRLPVPGGFDNIGAVYALVPDMRYNSNYFSAFKQEDNSIMICCGAWGSTPPNTIDGIIQHLSSIAVEEPVPRWVYVFLDMLREEESAMTYSAVRVSPSSWTHFEDASSLPSNWIAIGDSVSRTNPLFARGVPKILFGVLALNTLLHRTIKETTKTGRLPPNFSRSFFKAQAAKIKPIWNIDKATDYAHPTTIPKPGETLATGALMRRFMRHLQLLSTKDPRVGLFIWKSQMMLDRTSIDALHPVILAKVFWHAFKAQFVESKGPRARILNADSKSR